MTTFYTGTNRVADAVSRVSDAMAERLADEDARASLDSEMAITFAEHFAYQNAQARAFASGRLNQDEALLVYNALGEVGSSENGGWASDTPTAVKIAVTLLMGEILRP